MDFTGCLGGFPGEIGIFSDRYERVLGEQGVVVGGMGVEFDDERARSYWVWSKVL